MQHGEAGPEASPKVVVGLGNPGPRYAATRHNVGFLVADRVSDLYRVSFHPALAAADVASFEVEGLPVVVLKPRCFMNRSGRAVREWFDVRGDESCTFLVVYDDFSLPVGRIRFRAGGSAGGHNGMQSVLEALGCEEVARLRIGIGSPAPGEDPADFVLSPPVREEWAELREAVDRATQGVVDWLRGATIEECMNRYN